MVVYPVINLRRLQLGARAYVEGLEDTVIATLGTFGIEARVSVSNMCRTPLTANLLQVP